MITKGQAIQNNVHLFADMWPEAIEAAGHLTNQTLPWCREITPVRSRSPKTQEKRTDQTPSREITRDIEIQIFWQDVETSLEEYSGAGIGEKETNCNRAISIHRAAEWSMKVILANLSSMNT